ncbi:MULTISPECIES: DUF3237 domain-containing protein [Nocardia]|uniref:DUF3237 domain-containing protein n=1 Tax=Nocardia TaxID=1817 RepID=UPI001E3ED8C3|nr:DUF3237 domain-containing protein [Nocardia asteroides]UGT62328.1 DUF3237 domain-containing protein [Nocardia asteroides]
MELTRIGTVTAHLKPPQMIGPGPYGIRMFIEIMDGTLEGDPSVPEVNSIAGTVLPGGGDWVLIGADGWARLDVRVQFLTSNGAVVFAEFFGLIEMTDKVQDALMSGAATEFDDQYFRVTPRLETGDPQLEWVNQAVFLGEGRFVEGFGLQYVMYRVG